MDTDKARKYADEFDQMMKVTKEAAQEELNIAAAALDRAGEIAENMGFPISFDYFGVPLSYVPETFVDARCALSVEDEDGDYDVYERLRDKAPPHKYYQHGWFPLEDVWNASSAWC